MTLLFHCQLHGMTHEYNQDLSTKKKQNHPLYWKAENPHFFPRYINFPKFSENWPWINWIWNQSKWKDYYYTVLFAKSLSHYFSFFLIMLSFFLLLFVKREELTIIFWIAESYFHVTWKFQQWHLTCKCSAHHLLADSVIQEVPHHYTRYSAFLR